MKSVDARKLNPDFVSVLVACEFSGVVRDAFRRQGAEAWSCDFEEPEGEWKNYHLQGDCRWWLKGPSAPWDWDLVIAHPPCTYLCNSGVRWLKGNPARQEKMREAADFFRSLHDAPIRHKCIENPVPHGHAGLPPYSQIIQPWQFGHGETKATCLWLHKLPPLKPTQIVSGRRPRVHHASPGPDRWKERSRTRPGIAEAMAVQWLAHIRGEKP